LFVVDCKSNRAYVPLKTGEPGTGNGRVAVIDLSVDPNKVDPRLTTVVLTHPDIPHGTAADQDTGTVFVPSGLFMDLIDESTNKLVSGSPFPYPTGVQSGGGQVLFDPVRGAAVCQALNAGCPAGCTGFINFDEASRTFGAVIKAPFAETFALNPATGVVLDANDSELGTSMTTIDLAASSPCLLNDSNLGPDKDGASVDPGTNIWVISNEDGTATFLNLNGSSFSGAGTPSCMLNEAGTPPNSVLLKGLPVTTAGSAVNPITHEAFLIAEGDPDITLVSMPAKPVTQIMPTDLSFVTAVIPRDPLNDIWRAQGDPYAVAVGNCPNGGDFGYAVNNLFNFLVQVDLKAFKANPASISTALPAGNCKGTTSTQSCSNGSGVVFFPLPQ
jgi:hypothetical protein